MSHDPTRYSPPDGLLLASASPRRAELLRAAGIPFDIEAADVEESVLAGESPDACVRRLARAKAEAIARAHPQRAVLGADTIVVVDTRILGKPRDADEARQMLQALSGRTHIVLTGMTLIGSTAGASEHGAGRPSLTRVASTAVTFAPLSAAEIAWYVASEEPMGKAGAYAIQGLASRFVTHIDGSYANVVGLPVAELCVMCSELGILVS